MANEITRKPVIVWSEGSRLAAELITPAGDESLHPAILFCHGWGGLKEHLAERYAVPFANAGYACLVFDYRGWGGSDGRLISIDGTPMLTEGGERAVTARVIRELVDPIDQVADIRACLAWLAAEPGVDATRLGLWGSSYGGGHVIVVAGSDDRLRAVVSQIGGFGVPEPPASWTAYQRQREADKARAAIDPPVPQGIDGAPGLRGVPDVARQLHHAPLAAARNLRAPTLFIDAEFEEYAPPETHGYIVDVAGRAVTTERVVYPCSHYKVYDEYLEPARQRALEWFDRYLKSSTGGRRPRYPR